MLLRGPGAPEMKTKSSQAGVESDGSSTSYVAVLEFDVAAITKKNKSF